jgi:hypothetical protein
MRRRVRRLAWVGVALCAVALAWGVTERVFTPEPTVTEANVGRLREGMTLRDVEAILGTIHQMGISGHGARERVWVRRTGCAWVTFDDRTGGMIGAQFLDASAPAMARVLEVYGRPSEPSLLDRLRSLLGW